MSIGIPNQDVKKKVQSSSPNKPGTGVSRNTDKFIDLSITTVRSLKNL